METKLVMNAVAAIFKRCTTLIALLLAIVFVWSATGAAQVAYPKRLRQIESKTLGIDAEIKALDKQRIQLLAQVRRLADEIDQFKSKPNPNFLERRRLERLLGESQQAGEGLENIVSQIAEKKERYRHNRQLVYDAYTEEMLRSADRLSNESDREKIIAFTRYFLQLRDRRETFRPSGTQFGKIDFLSVEIRSGESLQSLQAKLDLLVKRRDRLKSAIKAIQKEIKALKKDLALGKQIKSLIDENNLFEEEIIFEREPRTIKIPEKVEDTHPSGAQRTGSGGYESGGHISPTGEKGDLGAFDPSGYSIDVEITRLESLSTFLSKVKVKLDRQIRVIKKAMRNAPSLGNRNNGKDRHAFIHLRGGER